MSHERIGGQKLVAEGEVYNELKQDQELNQLSSDLDTLVRKTEVTKRNIELEPYKAGREHFNNPWARMLAEIQPFDEKRAEQARADRKKEIAQKERLKNVERSLKEGDIEGREREIIDAIENLRYGATYEPAEAYNRFLSYTERGANPEEYPEKPRRNDWMSRENYLGNIKTINRIKHFSKEERNSLEHLAAFSREQKRLERERTEREREERLS